MTTDFANDPINISINDGIRRGIRVTLEHDCMASAVILIYAGMEAMASLGRPDGQEDVTPADFIRWADRYIALEGDTRVTGEEWYSARCGIFHTFTPDSRRTRSGAARRLSYMSKCRPPVRYDRNIDKAFVLVSVPALAEAFFAGIDRFLVDRFADPAIRPIMEERLRKLFAELPYERPTRQTEELRREM